MKPAELKRLQKAVETRGSWECGLRSTDIAAALNEIERLRAELEQVDGALGVFSCSRAEAIQRVTQRGFDWKQERDTARADNTRLLEALSFLQKLMFAEVRPAIAKGEWATVEVRAEHVHRLHDALAATDSREWLRDNYESRTAIVARLETLLAVPCASADFLQGVQRCIALMKSPPSVTPVDGVMK